MAKAKENADNPEKAEAAPKTDGRIKFVTHPVSGEQVKRADYIRELWAGKEMTRRQIADHLTEITGVTVLYQIVFQATKGYEGGPDPKPAEEPASEEGNPPEAA